MYVNKQMDKKPVLRFKDYRYDFRIVMIVLIALLNAQNINASHSTEKDDRFNTSLMRDQKLIINALIIIPNLKSCDEKTFRRPCDRETVLNEYSRLISSNNLNCTKLLKEVCGIETNDLVNWMNTQNIIKKRIDLHYKEENQKDSAEYEDFCSSFHEPPWGPLHYISDLPFCSLSYACFSSNYSLDVTKPIPENANKT